MDKETTQVIFFIVATSFILLMLSVLVINLLLVGRNRRLKHNNEVLEMKSNFEKELMTTQVEVAENTLNDIARDLHDDVGQMLTFSIIQLNNFNIANDESLNKKLSEVKDSVQNTLQSVRGISKTLSNDYLTSFGIFESLNRLFERINKQEAVKAELQFPEGILFRSKSNELFSFRIIQELVNNTLKHAEATGLQLMVTEENSDIKILYTDNGKGIATNKIQPGELPTGLGFTNIYKRAELMKGKMEITSEAGHGFNFILIFPNE